jgi:hypothetical protein
LNCENNPLSRQFTGSGAILGSWNVVWLWQRNPKACGNNRQRNPGLNERPVMELANVRVIDGASFPAREDETILIDVFIPLLYMHKRTAQCERGSP